MSIRKHLNLAMGELITARRRSEEANYSREFLYNMEVVIRACSRMKDQAREEKHAKQKEEEKAFKRAQARTHTRAKSKKKIKKRKQTPKRTRKAIAA